MTDYFSLGPVTMNVCINFGANFKGHAGARGTGNEWIFLRFTFFLSRICSYTFKLRTIIRSFSQCIRRAFVLEYSFQVSGVLSTESFRELTRRWTFFTMTQRFNHYESSVCWSEATSLSSTLSLVHSLKSTQPVFFSLSFASVFSCVNHAWTKTFPLLWGAEVKCF